MRSNIARTCPSSRVPLVAFTCGLLAGRARAVQRGEEVDQRGLLLLGQALERGHGRGRVVQRAPDRRRLQLVADVGEMRTRAVVAVLADLVARETARLGDDELARLELRRDLHVDRVLRAGVVSEV